MTNASIGISAMLASGFGSGRFYGKSLKERRGGQGGGSDRAIALR